MSQPKQTVSVITLLSERWTAPFMFAAMLVLILGLNDCFSIFNAVVQFQRSSSVFPTLSGMLPVPVIAVIMIGLRALITYSLTPCARRALAKNKWGAEETENRVARYCHAVFKCTYFLFATAIGWFLLKDQIWMPKSLFGSGDISKCWESWPHQVMPESLNWYYNVSAGYHLHSLIYQLAATRRNDFWEMFLHHICAMFLITFSYMTNMHRIGTLVLFLHDVGDVASYWVKVVVDTRHLKITLLAYCCMLVSWAYLRLYVLPFQVIRNTFEQAPTDFPGTMLLIALLCVLAMLHMYWYCLFLYMGANYIMTGKAVDIIGNNPTDDNISIPELKENVKSKLV